MRDAAEPAGPPPTEYCRAWERIIPLVGRFHFPLPRRGGPFVSPGFGTRLRTSARSASPMPGNLSKGREVARGRRRRSAR